MRAFGWSHEQYMDTPREAIDWLLRIHELVTAEERRQQDEANRQG